MYWENDGNLIVFYIWVYMDKKHWMFISPFHYYNIFYERAMSSPEK